MNNQISERRIRNNKLRRRRQLKRQLFTIIMTMVLITGFSVFGFGMNAKAQSAEAAADIQYKYYKRVMVESGDTIWNYAEVYADKAYYDSFESYINEVVQINALTDDEITSGQHLILPYYSSEFVN